MSRQANLIETGVENMLLEEKVRTPDMGGVATTMDVGERIIHWINS
jgi:isocitrate/isopropylmalate dehydrogenase